MFFNTLDPKYRLKYHTKKSTNKVVGLPWLEFSKNLKIRSAGEVTYFNPYEYQIKLVDLILDGSCIVAKSRQLGISETVCSYLLWRATNEPGYLALVFSKTQTDSSLLARRIRRMLESINLNTTTDNLCDIEIVNGGRILFKNSSPDSARGLESVVDVFLDEYAFIHNDKEIYSSLLPSLQMLGDKARVICVSTPNGQDNHFYQLLAGDEKNRLEDELKELENNPFKYWKDPGGWWKVLIHWSQHPLYGSDPNFLDTVKVKRKMTTDKIEQEYCLNFSVVREGYFDSQLIRDCVDENIKPNEGKGYAIMGIDPSGMGRDYTVGLVGVSTSYHDQVLVVDEVYRVQKATMNQHLYGLSEIIEKREIRLVGIEKNSLGQIWMEELAKNNPLTSVHGIHTTIHSKLLMLDRVKFLMESQRLWLPSYKPLINELLSYSLNGDGHDDTVMALCMLVTITQERHWG